MTPLAVTGSRESQVFADTRFRLHEWLFPMLAISQSSYAVCFLLVPYFVTMLRVSFGHAIRVA